MIPLTYYLGLSVILFRIGILGVLLRRNANCDFYVAGIDVQRRQPGLCGLCLYYQILDGQIFVFFVMTVAAAEVAVGLALMVAIFRAKKSIDVDQMNIMKG